VYAPSNPNIVYGGLRKTVSGGHLEPSFGPSFGVFKSTDGGETWLEKNSGLESSYKAINTIVVHPKNSNIAYAGTLHDGVYKTTNGGESWVRVCNGLGFADVRSLAIDPENLEIVYAGSGDGKGIAKSLDGGNNWQETNRGLRIECPSYLSSVGRGAAGFDLTKPKNLFGTDSYNFVPWTKIFDIVVDPHNHTRVYAADLNTGIYLSTDGGDSWYPINEGLSIKSVTCLAISSDGEVLYAGTSGGGVHRMVVGGNKAPQVLATVPNASDTVFVSYGDSLSFGVMAFDLDGDSLVYSWTIDGATDVHAKGSHYVLKTGDKLVGFHVLVADISDKDTAITVRWTIEIVTTTGVVRDRSSDGALAFYLDQNYPNPFNPSTTIKFSIPQSGFVTLKLFNVLGGEVATLVSERLTAGRYSAHWNASQCASGVYLCRLQVGEFQQTRKLTLLR
jgi:photosystem II stability/assembly factor-like uncharacterized protein